MSNAVQHSTTCLEIFKMKFLFVMIIYHTKLERQLNGNLLAVVCQSPQMMSGKGNQTIFLITF